MVVVLFRWCTRSKQRSGYSEGTRALEKSVLITMVAVFIKAFFTIVMITKTVSYMKFKFTWSNGLETEEEEVPDHVLVVVVQPGDSDDDYDDADGDDDEDDDDEDGDGDDT